MQFVFKRAMGEQNGNSTLSLMSRHEPVGLSLCTGQIDSSGSSAWTRRLAGLLAFMMSGVFHEYMRRPRAHLTRLNEIHRASRLWFQKIGHPRLPQRLRPVRVLPSQGRYFFDLGFQPPPQHLWACQHRALVCFWQDILYRQRQMLK